MLSFAGQRLCSKTLKLARPSLYALFLTCLVVNTGCLSDEDYHPFRGELREFVHQNGLVVKLPKTLAATGTDDGFLIEPAGDLNKHLHNQLIIWIEKRENKGPTALINVRQKTVGKRIINYRIEQNEDGSGGAEYRLTAWEKVEGIFVVYKQTQQSEDGEPNFTTCWQIIEKTEINK